MQAALKKEEVTLMKAVCEKEYMEAVPILRSA